MLKILVLDSGIGLCHAIKLGREGHQVFLYSLWQDPFPKFKDFVIGDGFTGITKIQDWAEKVQDVDFILFTDCGFGAFADYLRDSGFLVCGAGRADRLEMDRRFFHKVCDELGVIYPRSWNIDGVSNLLKFFKNEAERDKTYYVKLNTFRGDLESVGVSGYDEAEILFKNFEAKVGPYAESFQFVVEEEVKGVEIGVDTFFNSRDYLLPVYFTFEHYDNTLGKWEMENVWLPVLAQFRSYLSKMGYRGPVSFEGIYDGNDIYILDPTLRFAYPTSSATFCQVIKNYGELLYALARGEDYDFDVSSPYAIGVNVYSEQNFNRWLLIDVEKKAKFWPRRACWVNGRMYMTPGEEGETIVGVVVGEGQDYKETFDDASVGLKNVSVYGMSYNWGVFTEFVEAYIEPLKKYGIDF